MEIAFKTRRLQKACNSDALLQRTYGTQLAKKIKVRLSVLRQARNLSLVPTEPPVRRHQLKGDRDETYAVDLGPRQRMVFAANHETTPRNEDGGIAIHQVTAVKIIEIADYH